MTGAQILKGIGAVAAGLGILFAIQRMGPNRHSNNQAENKLIDYFEQKYKFDKDFRQRLHRKINRKGYNKKIIEEIIRELLGLDN